jgi:urea carboxylase-associated protein 2
MAGTTRRKSRETVMESAMTPEDYRRRYFELKAQAQEANSARPQKTMGASEIMTPDKILAQDTIPPGWYWTRHLARGESLRIVNDKATAGVSALFWSAADPSERLNVADTVKVQWTARLSRGRLLLSDMGRALCSITEDTCGYHDFVSGCSSRASDEKKYGPEPTRRNSRENFVLAAAKHGLSARDVPPCVSFFAPVVTDEKGRFHWEEGAAKPGQFVDLRAEMDLIFVLSNCPHPLSPATSWKAEPVTAIVWQSSPAGAEDFCRTATEEAVRAFENTDAFLTALGEQ